MKLLGCLENCEWEHLCVDGGHRGKVGGADQGPEQVIRAEEFGHYHGNTRGPQRESKHKQAQDRATIWDRYMRLEVSRDSSEQLGRVLATSHIPSLRAQASNSEGERETLGWEQRGPIEGQSEDSAHSGIS